MTHRKLRLLLVCVSLATACFVGLMRDSRENSPDRDTASNADARDGTADQATAATEHPTGRRAEGLPPIDLTTCDRDTDVFGVVVDLAGIGIPDARVGTIFHPWGPLVREAHLRLEDFRDGPFTTTSSDGSFRMAVPRGSELGVWARKTGYADARIDPCLAGERVNLTLHQGASIQVIVSDDEARPLPGVEVGWSRGNWEVKARSLAPILTDAAGSCLLEGLACDEGTTLRACDRRTGLAATAYLAASTDEIKVARITLSEEGALRGIVLDAVDRKPIPGAQVGWIPDDAASGRTDAEGRFTLSKSSVLCVFVLVQMEGYVQQLVEPKPGPLEILLRKSALLTGRLVDPSGTPVAGGRVLLSWYNDAGNGPTTLTDDSGRFRIGGFPSESGCEVAAWKDGYGRITFRFFLGEGNTDDLDLGDLVLPKSLAIEGSLLDRKGKPVPATNVTLSGGNTDFFGNPPPKVPNVDVNRTSESCRTDDLGRFRFHNLAPGRYSVWCQLPDAPGASVEVGLRERDALGVELRFPEGRSVTVRVVDEVGNPLPGVSISSSEFLQIGWARTGDDGSAVIVIEGAGKLEVRVPDGYLPVPHQRVSETQTEVQFKLEKSQTIRGRVEGIEPRTGKYDATTVRAFLGSLECAYCKVAEAGTFELTVRTGAVVDLLAVQTIGEGPPFRVRSRRVPSIPAGADDVTLHLQELVLDRSLSVRVLGSDGQPVPGVRVMARSLVFGSSGLTGPDGRVELSGLPDSPLKLRGFVEGPEVSGGKVTPVENVVPRGQEIELHIPPNDAVIGKVVGPSGEPIRGAEVKLLQANNEYWEASAVSDSAGNFRLEFSPLETPPFRVEVEAEVEGAGLLAGKVEDVKPGDSGLLIRLKTR